MIHSATRSHAVRRSAAYLILMVLSVFCGAAASSVPAGGIIPGCGAAVADNRSGESSKPATSRFTITHGPIVTQLTTPGSAGHQLGDLRVLPATPIFNRSMVEVGRLDGQLITTSVDYPTPGDEVRMTTLNFVFGAATGHLAGSADQIIVSGSGYYPSTLSTIAAGLKLIRPITGGSGRYAGASGWAETEHLGDDSWRHTFYLLRSDKR